MSVTDIKPFSLRTYTSEDNDFILIIGYQCQTKDQLITLNWEHDNYKWLEKEDALSQDLTEDARFFVEQFNLE